MPYLQTCLLHKYCKNSFLVLFLSLLPVDSQTSFSSIFSSLPLSLEPIPGPCRPSGPASPAWEAGRACCRQEGAAGDSQPSWLQGHGHPVCVEPGEQEPLQERFNPISELAGGHSCPARGTLSLQTCSKCPFAHLVVRGATGWVLVSTLCRFRGQGRFLEFHRT